MEKKLGDGLLSNRIEELYNKAVKIREELETIPKDADYWRRLQGLDDSKHLISDFSSRVEEIKKLGLMDYADAEKLIDFIFQWSIRQPEILIGAVEALRLKQAWSKLPDRLII